MCPKSVSDAGLPYVVRFQIIQVFILDFFFLFIIHLIIIHSIFVESTLWVGSGCCGYTESKPFPGLQFSTALLSGRKCPITWTGHWILPSPSTKCCHASPPGAGSAFGASWWPCMWLGPAPLAALNVSNLLSLFPSALFPEAQWEGFFKSSEDQETSQPQIKFSVLECKTKDKGQVFTEQLPCARHCHTCTYVIYSTYDEWGSC